MDDQSRGEAAPSLRDSVEGVTWEQTFDSVPDLVAIFDTQYRVVRVNRAMARRLGRSPAECVGLTCFEAIHGLREPPEFCPNARTLAERREYTVEVHEERLGGDFLVTTSPLIDAQGRLLGSVHVAHDITDRKRAEEALRRSEEQYRGLLEACPDAVVMSDPFARILFASRHTRTLLGLEDSEPLVGKSVLDYVIEEDRQRLADNFADLATTGIRRNTYYTARRRDGATVPTEVSSAVVRDAAGQPKAMMAVIRDISERRRTQEALQKQRRTLEHMLQASDHERQLIAYDIHDGLAQQLAGAMMQFQMRDHLQGEDRAQAERAYRQGVDLLRQAHLETRRLISGLRPPILDESGIVAAIDHLIEERPVDQGPKVEFQTKVQFDRLAPVLENVLYRIVQEGLTNALRHSKSDRVEISLQQRGEAIRLAIRDYGVGFDPKAVRGASYGLAGIRQRARLLGGKCRIRSKPGAGTTISVELPLVECESDSQ